MGLLWVAASEQPELPALPGNHCSGTDQGIKLRMSHLQKEGELEKFRRKKRHLDFLDILLIARVSVCRRGLRLCTGEQKKGQTLTSQRAFPRWRM